MAAGYPLPAPPPTPGMSRGTKMLLWSLGSCGVLLALLIVGSLVFGAVVASRMFNIRIGDAAVPADFPVYPGSRQTTGISIDARNQNRVSVSVVQWDVPARADIVTSWYRTHLDRADWQVDSPEAGTIDFHRRSTGARATLMIRGNIASTLVQLEMTGGHPLVQNAEPAASPVN